jgi:TonB family protein
MPKLPEASGMAGIVAAVQQRVLLPPTAPAGRVFVQFIVTKEGMVSQLQVVKGLRADVDSAVVAATRKLPRFTPGNQNGRVVPVRLTLLVPIAGQQP